MFRAYCSHVEALSLLSFLIVINFIKEQGRQPWKEYSQDQLTLHQVSWQPVVLTDIV